MSNVPTIFDRPEAPTMFGSDAPKVFNFNEYDVRVFLLNNDTNKPYFCLTDVCCILGLSHANATKLDLDLKGCRTVATLTNGGIQQLNYISEPNLYRVIFKSRKENAVVFQDWVFNDVLPSIRKTGSYSYGMPQTKIEAVEAYLESLKREEALKAEVAELAPQAMVAQKCLAPIGAMNAKEFADLLCKETGRKVSNQYILAALRACGLLGKGTNTTSYNAPLPSNPISEYFVTYKSPDVSRMSQAEYEAKLIENPYFNAPCMHIHQWAIPLVLNLFLEHFIPAIGSTGVRDIDKLDLVIPKEFITKAKNLTQLAKI